MTDAERIAALLDLADPDRNPNPGQSAKLVVLGLAEPSGKSGIKPSNAGWALLGAPGRPFRKG